MWTRTLGTLVLLIAASYVAQALFPQARGRPREPKPYLMWDLAPLLGFFGALLLVLSFVEALRQQVLVAWGGGSALGLVAGLGLWLTLAYGGSRSTAIDPPARKKESTWRLMWHFLRTYGPPLLLVSLALNVAIRWMGSALEVFAAGAAGVFVIALALAVFAGARRLGNP